MMLLSRAYRPKWPQKENLKGIRCLKVSSSFNGVARAEAIPPSQVLAGKSANKNSETSDRMGMDSGAADLAALPLGRRNCSMFDGIPCPSADREKRTTTNRSSGKESIVFACLRSSGFTILRSPRGASTVEEFVMGCHHRLRVEREQLARTATTNRVVSHVWRGWVPLPCRLGSVCKSSRARLMARERKCSWKHRITIFDGGSAEG